MASRTALIQYERKVYSSMISCLVCTLCSYWIATRTLSLARGFIYLPPLVFDSMPNKNDPIRLILENVESGFSNDLISENNSSATLMHSCKFITYSIQFMFSVDMYFVKIPERVVSGSIVRSPPISEYSHHSAL